MQHSRPLKFEEAPRIQWKSKGLVLICQKIGYTMELYGIVVFGNV